MYDGDMKPNKNIEKKSNEKKFKGFNVDFNWQSALKKFGILCVAVFAIIFVSAKIGQGSEKKVLEKNLETLKTGAYQYFKENEKPTEVSDEINVTLQELIDSKVITELKDKKGNTCDTDTTNVTLTKKTSTKYDLVAHLECDQKEEVKEFSLTYAGNSSNSSKDEKNVYYRLQKEVSVDNFTYTCPDGYTLNGKYCYSKSVTLSATPIAKYKTTPAKTEKASYKKPSDEYEYVEVIKETLPVSYSCSDKNATLVGDKCIITKDADYKEDTTYSCTEGVLEGSKCVLTKKAEMKDYKYTCPSGEKFGEDQCELKRSYKASYDCPDDYPNKDGKKCYYSEKAEKDWGDWKYSSKSIFSSEKDDTDYKKYDLVDSYEGTNGKTKYVYKVYTRAKEYICDDDEDVKLKGSRCYFYTDAYEEKKCESGYELNKDETKCIKIVDAKKVKAPKTYTCEKPYNKVGSGEDSKCVLKVDANKNTAKQPVCPTGYEAKATSPNVYSCVKTTEAKKLENQVNYVCPTGYEKKGSGEDTKCFKKTQTEGYYYCKNTEATLKDNECITEAKTELTGYKCPSGYDYNGTTCLKVTGADKVSATKTNDPKIEFTYKWSSKKSESGWTWTGETKDAE